MDQHPHSESRFAAESVRQPHLKMQCIFLGLQVDIAAELQAQKSIVPNGAPHARAWRKLPPWRQHWQAPEGSPVCR